MSTFACPQCQTINEAGARFCGGCGQPLPVQAAPAPYPPAQPQPPYPPPQPQPPYTPPQPPAPYGPQGGPYPAPPIPPARKKRNWGATLAGVAGVLAIVRACTAFLPDAPEIKSASGKWSIIASGSTAEAADWVAPYRAGERDAAIVMTGNENQTRIQVWDIGADEPKRLENRLNASQLTGWTAGDLYNQGSEVMMYLFGNQTHWLMQSDLTVNTLEDSPIAAMAIGDFDADGQQEVTFRAADEEGQPYLALFRYQPGQDEPALLAEFSDVGDGFFFERGTRSTGGAHTLAARQENPDRITQWRWNENSLVEDSSLSLGAGNVVWWTAGTLKGGREAIITSHRADGKSWVVIHEYQGGRFTEADRLDLPKDGAWVAMAGLFRQAEGELALYDAGTGEYFILAEA